MSCYNSLPLAGGGSTLVRLNLKAIAERSESLDDFFTRTLPHYCQQQIAIIDARCEFLYQQSHFFENSFLVKEGLINPERFVPMFGMYGLAEAVNLLCEKEGIAARYGKEAAANEVGYRISAQLAEFVANTPREIWLAKTRHVTRTVGDQFRYRHHAGRAFAVWR